ncbi:MAG: hypothetical protein Q9M94_00370 [Candidatus Gracilibacteria bacterium]|nr:hypothetical protein [Candidatus Gracilibacteria bacterium]
MTLIETPGLLIGGEESHYLEKFKSIFENNNKIILPETEKPVFVYLNKDNAIYHLWRGGKEILNYNFDDAKYWRKAQRIGWIKFILEKNKIRKIYKDKKNGYFCFVSTELEYTIVLKELKNSFLIITSYHTFDPYRYITKPERFVEVKTI